MRRIFVETENVGRFLRAFDALERRGAEEASLMVVDGLPGLGKTTTLTWWVAQTQTIHLRALKEWTPQWMLADLLGSMGVTPGYSFQRRYSQALAEIIERQRRAAQARRPFAIVIDEADHVSRNARIMETLRDFSDNVGVTIILVGMGKIRTHLTAFPQIASRIGQYVKFDKATIGDVRRLAAELCEVPVADDLVQFVHTVSDGFNREIKEALASIERFGRRNGAGEGKPVTLAAMAGETIANDRRTGAPILVPGRV